MKHALETPFDAHLILRKKKALRRQMLEQHGLLDKRVAILGGSTTAEVKEMLELFLLKGGIRPAFHESEYGRFELDALYDNPELAAFAPEIIYLHTTVANIARFPAPTDSVDEVESLLNAQLTRTKDICEALTRRYGCLILLNNYEFPALRLLGNMDCVDHRGRTSFVSRLNLRLAEYVAPRKHLLLHDLNHLAARFGLDRWHDTSLWFSYKYALCYEAVPHLAHSLASMIKAAFGLSRKCLVLDLDNTLWGGVIGDDGVEGIKLGPETAQGEAYQAFQSWVRGMRDRGVILAICSKNDEENALAGLAHPDSLLAPADFSAIATNWEPKHENIRTLAKTLNIGLDSMVFVDDNPAEREIVSGQLPEVAVPEVGQDVSEYPRFIDSSGLFESAVLVADDLKRSSFYTENARRAEHQERFADYSAYLRSLEMTAEIGPFQPVHLDRIAQLTNKTNQFNLTTRRYSLAEIRAVAENPDMLHLSGRLTDKFGDNGLISVIIAQAEGTSLDILLWLMSCRVLKRGMEDAMFDALAKLARARGLTELRAEYLKTPKNSMVAEHYAHMGFERVHLAENGDSRWRFPLTEAIPPRNTHIRILP